MSYTSTYVCDRCKTTVTAMSNGCSGLLPVGWTTVMVMNEVKGDLCRSCANELELFLKGEDK